MGTTPCWPRPVCTTTPETTTSWAPPAASTSGCAPCPSRTPETPILSGACPVPRLRSLKQTIWPNNTHTTAHLAICGGYDNNIISITKTVCSNNILTNCSCQLSCTNC